MSLPIVTLLQRVALFLGCTVAAIAASTSFEADATQRFHELTKGDVPGFAVLVARNGQVVFQGGFGLANIEAKVPIQPATKFRIGSISKQFTAAAVLRLSEQGKLSLSDTLATYFPDFPNGREITIRHLLTHTSGLHSYTEKPEFYGRVTNAITSSQLLAWFHDDPPDFKPGNGFHYSNSGYFVLGEIVSKVSGKSLGDYLKDSFFDPLGMKDTGIYTNSAPPPGMAQGYEFNSGKYEAALDWDMSWAGGAGALYSTVGDLFLWNEALFGGRVLNADSFQAATTPVSLPPNVGGMSYGYGLVMSTVKGLPVVSHSGGLDGWTSDLLRVTDQKCTVVVLANYLTNRAGSAPVEISHKLVEQLLADEIKKLPPPKEDSLANPKRFKDYVGRYDYQTAIMTVTIEGDALFAQLTGQEKFRIFPKARDEFFWKVTDAQVVFLRDDKGQVSAARHTQNGNSFRAPKLAADTVRLSTEALDAFVGQYQYGPMSILTVTRDGNQLLAQLTGQSAIPIFPTSNTEFEWRVVSANVRFVKGANGKVIKAVHTQGGASFEAPKIP